MTIYYFFFNDTSTTYIYTYCHTLSLHDALPISGARRRGRRPRQSNRRRARLCRRRRPQFHRRRGRRRQCPAPGRLDAQAAPLCPGHRKGLRSEEHTSEVQSLMRISYAVFCLKKKKKTKRHEITHIHRKKD